MRLIIIFFIYWFIGFAYWLWLSWRVPVRGPYSAEKLVGTLVIFFWPVAILYRLIAGEPPEREDTESEDAIAKTPGPGDRLGN